MKLMSQIKDKNNLPILLFLIVLINYVPLFINNAFTKESKAVGMSMMALCFCIEIVLLVFFYWQNRKSVQNIKVNSILLLGVVFILFMVQVKNWLQHNFYWMDILNIGCMFVNIILFYIAVYDFKISEKNMVLFFKGIFWIGIVAVVWNCVLFYQEIGAELGFLKLDNSNHYIKNIKGFFANRNSLAFFLYIAVMANAFIVNFEKNKRFYKISFFIFLFGIWCTHSKTGYVLAVGFLEGYLFLNDNYTIKKRIKMCFLVGMIGVIGILNIMGILPKQKNVIALDNIKTLSSRTVLWEKGIEILNNSPANYIFGVGRFRATHGLTLKNKTFTQFHNIYLEMILTGGIIQFTYIGFLYFGVIRKIMKSHLEKNFKRIYFMMYLTYAVYMMSESLRQIFHWLCRYIMFDYFLYNAIIT